MKILRWSDDKEDPDYISPRNDFVLRLKNRGLLKAGLVIRGQQVEEILGIKYIGPDDWNFLGKYFVLKTQIEARGFFITQANLDAPSFRILDTEEMAQHATKKLHKALGITFKTALIMSTHDSTDLKGEEKRRYTLAQTQAANMALASQKILMDDFVSNWD